MGGKIGAAVGSIVDEWAGSKVGEDPRAAVGAKSEEVGAGSGMAEGVGAAVGTLG